MEITFENRREILKQLDKTSCVKFAIKAARLVSHLNDDPRVETVIKAAEAWVENPSEENREAAATAATAAGAAAYDAVAYAGYGVDATATAAAAGYATCWAADDGVDANAAAAAAGAAWAADDSEEIKQQLIQYLKELAD